MHPLLKRILIHGALTAAALAGVGVMFAQMAGIWTSASASRPGAAELNTSVTNSIRTNVPLMMAFWGFVFVAAVEGVRWRLRGGAEAAAKPAEPQHDDVEKLLNELLEQAESKMALEAESQKAEAEGQGAEGAGQTADAQKTA